MIFVTGGTGLVGAHVLLKLSQKREDFKALKRTSSCLDVCKRIFKYYKSEELFKKINWCDGDIIDIVSLENGMRGCNLLLHCAGIVSFSPNDVERLKKVNIEGTANVMNVALSSGIKKVGYISSIATLGRNLDNALIDEKSYFIPSKKESNYALSKYFAEQEIWRASQEGMEVVILNPSIILGPGDWKKGSSQIFETIYKGLNFYTNGSSGYVDVCDVADLIIMLLFSDIKNERFIANSANLKYRDCFEMIALALGKKPATIKVTPILKEIAWRLEAIKFFITGVRPLLTRETANSAMSNRKFSTEKIKSILDFQFKDINDTIRKYANWFVADQG